MASVIKNKSGRWEVRESYRTEKGPRSRTLATFAELTPDHVHLVIERSEDDLTEDAVRQIARRAGAPVARSRADTAAIELLRAVGRREEVSPGLIKLLRDVFSDGPMSPWAEEAVEHVGLSLEEKAVQFEDLMAFVDAVPKDPRWLES